MKIINLQIENIRGIKNTPLNLAGKNLAIWGPNGSGKSAVIDSIDFLLTGNIGRLTGKGTGNIKLTKHGPHVDVDDLTKSFVRADVQISGMDGTIQFERCMAAPGVLKITGIDEKELTAHMSLTSRRQHILTRREILNFITADGATRAQEIQTLLDVSDIEDIRKNLVSVKKTTEREEKASESELSTAKAEVNSLVGIDTYSEEDILAYINKNRAVLDGKPLEKVDPQSLSDGLKSIEKKIAEKGGSQRTLLYLSSTCLICVVLLRERVKLRSLSPTVG